MLVELASPAKAEGARSNASEGGNHHLYSSASAKEAQANKSSRKATNTQTSTAGFTSSGSSAMYGAGVLQSRGLNSVNCWQDFLLDTFPRRAIILKMLIPLLFSGALGGLPVA